MSDTTMPAGNVIGRWHEAHAALHVDRAQRRLHFSVGVGAELLQPGSQARTNALREIARVATELAKLNSDPP